MKRQTYNIGDHCSAFWYITPCMLELIEPAEDADDELLSAIIGG